jgi:hypothetical protein
LIAARIGLGGFGLSNYAFADFRGHFHIIRDLNGDQNDKTAKSKHKRDNG